MPAPSKIEAVAKLRERFQCGHSLIIADYRGVPVLSAYTPLELDGVRWALMAEIDRETIAGGIPGEKLMERAGQALAAELLDFLEENLAGDHHHGGCGCGALRRILGEPQRH